MKNIMNKQRGSAAVIALVAVLGFFVLIGGFLAMNYVSAVNYGAATESAIKAQYTQNQNVLGQYTQKVQEVAQVPGMMRDDLDKITKDAIQGRYGENGSKAVFQMIKEQNPNLDSKAYLKIQQIIEAGRDDFRDEQKKLIDLRRNYETNLNYFMKGFFLRLAGYPKINLDDYKIITNTYTENAFKSGKEEGPLKLR